MPSLRAASTPSMLAMPLSTVIRKSGRREAAKRNDFRREPVTILEAIGHQVLDLCADALQRDHPQRTGRGSVGVVIGDDQQALPGGDRIGKQSCHRDAIFQAAHRSKPIERGIELLRGVHAPRGIHACQHRVHAARTKHIEGRLRHAAGDDARSAHAIGAASCPSRTLRACRTSGCGLFQICQ